MNAGRMILQRTLLIMLSVFVCAPSLRAQQNVIDTRDPRQRQDDDFAKFYAQWTSEPRYGSPLVDHLPKVDGIPSPKDVLGYHVGAAKKLTYYDDILKYYRALAAATPRVKVETIGRSDEGRELVVVWVSSDQNIANLAQNRANMAKLADPRGLSEEAAQQVIRSTKPHYHLMGGLHSGETGPSEMLMELAYRLATETSPVISQIRENVYVSITPAAEPDGRDRNVDWFYQSMERAAAAAPASGDSAAGGGRGGAGGGSVPYWGKYVHHDNNRDINLSQMSMRAITDWYFTAHPPIMHDLHESLTLLYTYSGGPPQNPNLDPLLFGELSFYANWELAQMTKWQMPGVYTHAFMDGWSPGYLGSVAYNHNGMMKMYETQSGRDFDIDSLRKSAATARATTTAATTAAAPPQGGRAGGGQQGRAGAPGGQQGRAGAQQAGGAQQGGGAPQGGGRVTVPSGRGGGQAREWYRGIPVPQGATNQFTRRNNTNYMQTGVLSSLQLTSMFPQLVLENFYVKTKNSMEAGSAQAPYGYVFPVQRDMTRVVTLMNVLRAQGIEVGTLNNDLRMGSDTFPSGSYVVKLNQPYGRLAKNLLERQDYPDANLTTYDDSGWTMGHAFDVAFKEIKDKAVLDAKTTLVDSAVWKGRVAGNGTAALAVAHLGSTNMVTFRYRLRDLPMKVAERVFTAEKLDFPAGSYIVTGTPAQLQAARAVADSLGLTAAALDAQPTVPTHDGDAPRVAIYSQWTGTQDLGWYRYTFDRFGIPFDLIYKERIAKGNLKQDYDVIVMAAQGLNRTNVLAQPAARPQPYQRSDKYRFLGMYGETPDMSGGFGEAGVDAFEKFLEAGGTLITAAGSVRFPIEFGFAHTIDTEAATGVNAQKPLLNAEIVRTDHPVFYGYEDKIFPMKYVAGGQLFRVGVADQGNILARYVGGDSAVLSGLMVGADNIKNRAFAVDVPNAHNGKGRVLMFANNPIYRWQNHGEFNMVFNSILNWNDVPPAPPMVGPGSGRQGGGRQGGGGGGLRP